MAIVVPRTFAEPVVCHDRSVKVIGCMKMPHTNEVSIELTDRPEHEHGTTKKAEDRCVGRSEIAMSDESEESSGPEDRDR